MKTKIKLHLKNVFANHIINRRTMFIPILFVSTFMLVGYAAFDKESPVIISDNLEIPYGEAFDTSVIEITDNRASRDIIKVEVEDKALNVDQLGSYEVEVSATDEFSNVAVKKIKINVVDNMGPKFQVLGANEGYVIQVPVLGSNDLSSYIKAMDNVDGDVTPFIVADAKLDTSKIGFQTITLIANDSSNNITKKTYLFSINDLVSPVINLSQGEDIIVDYASEFKISDYISVTDNLDGEIIPVVTGAVDTKKLDQKQTITVSASDGAGNKVESTLNITVKDISAPVITLSQTQLLVKEGTVVDSKAYLVSAIDNKDSNVTSKVTMNTIDTNGKGSRTITYTVSDAAGNVATANLVVNIDTGANEKVVAAALAQIGVTQDCTMLVTNSLKARGIYFHGWPIEYFSLGHEISASEAQPGDIVYYANGGTGLAHVALYIGNGEAVHGGWHGTTVRYKASYSTCSTPRYIRIDR